MALKIAADIHGDFQTLAGQLSPEDTLILCGDYIQFIDYETLDGVMAELVPKERIERVLRLIREDRLKEAQRAIGEVFVSNPELRSGIMRLMERDYRRMFSLIPCRTYLIAGNTDNPRLMAKHLGDNHHLVDAETVRVDGALVGLVGGMPPTSFSFGLPGEVTESEYARRLDSLGRVDVLVTHPPPAIRELTYDVVAERDEEGSRCLLEYIERFAPPLHYFGHVHQPMKNRLRHGETDLLNVSFQVLKKKVWIHDADQ